MTMKSARTPVIAAVVLVLLGTGCTTIVRSSSAPSGAEANGDSFATFGPSSLSNDGRYVSFNSDASNLVPGDTNGAQDSFRRDNVTGETIRVTLKNDGSQIPGASGAYSMSGDGTHVIFATDVALEPADTNGKADVYVRSVPAGTTERVSLKPDGSPVLGPDLFPALEWASISDDGRLALVTDLAPPVNGRAYLRNLDTNTTTVLSTISDRALLAGDGDWIVETSLCQNSPCDPHSAFISTDDATREEFSEGCRFWVSDVTPDARFVVGRRYPYDNAQCPEPRGLVRWDRVTKQAVKIPVEFESPLPPAEPNGMRVSSDGRFVSLIDELSYARVIDMTTGRTITVDTDYLGRLRSIDDAFNLSISGNGRYVAFNSVGPRTPDDTNRRSDVVTRYAITPGITSVTPNTVARAAHVTMQVGGAEFLSGATASFSGSGITVNQVTVVNTDRVDIELTVAANAPTGPRDLVVSNTGGFGASRAWCPACLTVN